MCTAHFPCIFPRLGETGTHFADAAAIKKQQQLKRQSSGAKGEGEEYENKESTIGLVENSATRQKWAGGMEGGEKEDTEETEPPSHSQARNARESSRGFFSFRTRLQHMEFDSPKDETQKHRIVKQVKRKSDTRFL